MAEFALGLARARLQHPLLVVLKEALQLQGAGGFSLEWPAREDTPSYQELQLNICMVSEMFVQILAAGLGALALLWATVVLLGGFSTSLQQADFWVITAIVFIQAARVVGINVSPEAEFFNQVPQAFLQLGTEHYTTRGGRRHFTGNKIVYYALLALGGARDFIIIMAFLAILVLAVPMIVGLGCISLSIYRLLVFLSGHCDNSNVFRALILFYALVLLQGGLFIMWLVLKLYRFYLANRVSLEYGLKKKRELIDKYMDETLSTAIQNGLSRTINSNLASFAANLIKSDYSQDRIVAISLIHTLTSQQKHRKRTVSQIQSSPLCVSRLLDMVTSKSRTDQSTKIWSAEIVAHLASNLRLADISGATDSISSMFDPYFTKISTQATNDKIAHQRAINITNDQQGSKPLIIHGMLILEKLAVNLDNCKKIYDSKGLFSKIIWPVKNNLYKIPSDDGITIEITEKALKVVSKLVSGTDEINRKIRQDICRNGIVVNNICPIFQGGDIDNRLKVPATKILTEIYFDMSTRATTGCPDIGVFTDFLMKIFFGTDNDSRLRKTAGKELAGLAMDNVNCTRIVNFSTGTETSVVQRLTAMIFEENSRLYRTSIAQLLMQICANSDSNSTGEILGSVRPNLYKVLRVVCNIEQEAHASQADSPQPNPCHPLLVAVKWFLPGVLRPRHSHAANINAPGDNLSAVAQLRGGRRKSLAAFLGILMEICEKLKIGADEFDNALTEIHLSMNEFVDKLNDIIKQCHSDDSLEGNAPSVDYLTIIKTVAMLCAWMMDNIPYCHIDFQINKTSERLQGALKDMRELELGMLLTGSAGDMANYKTLSSIVGAALQKIDA